jgi:hypothetical protein
MAGMTKAELRKRWAIGVTIVVCTAIPAFYLLSPFGQWLPQWFRYPTIGLLWLVWTVGSMLVKKYAKRIRQYPPDFIPPSPPYDVQKPMPPGKKDLSP